jgi:hypothetical protein
MDTARIFMWNIENFGLFNKLKKGVFDVRVEPILQFISTTVYTQEVNVLVIQEFRSQGIGLLVRIAAYLTEMYGVQWHFDWIPGAVETVGQPTSILDLGFDSRANTEGYAVLWQGDILTAFDIKLSYGADNDQTQPGYISLSLEGMKPEFEDNVPIPIQVPDSGAATAQSGYPQSLTTPVNYRPEKNRYILQWQHVRRPAVIKFGTIPILVYHSPNGNVSSYYGALAALLSRELVESATNGTASAIGGDFNIISDKQLTANEGYYLERSLVSQTVYRGDDYDPEYVKDGFLRTMVHYSKKGNITQFCEEGHCLGSPRDLLFSGTNMTNANGYPLQVLDQLMDITSDLAIATFANENLIAMITDAINSPNPEFQLPSLVMESEQVLTDLQAPWYMDAGSRAFPTQVSAAAFYRCFISDHLPIFLSFDY